jgi:hypothetical protein
MSDRFNPQEFVKDYCNGVRDQEMLAKFNITGRQMLSIVKKLINEGVINKRDYFERAKRIEDAAHQREKQFLQSLYSCDICGHLQPDRFEQCPACGADASEITALRESGVVAAEPSSLGDTVIGMDMKAAEAAHKKLMEQGLAPVDSIPQAKNEAAPAPAAPVSREQPSEPPPQEEEMGHQMHDDIEIPEYIERLVGVPVESPEWDARVDSQMREAEYVLTEVAAYSEKAVVFKAEPSEGDGPPIGVKLFHSEMDEEEDLPGIVDMIIRFQSAMKDPNIIEFYGSGTVEGVKALLYEFMPLSLEWLIKQNPDGMSLDKVVQLLPQLLNGLGYAHTHRGADGVVRRLGHYSLKSSNILMDRDTGVVKLDDCGFIKALLEVRGSRGYLWQEPGVGLAGLAPETFVLDGKFINGQLVDIYALGVVLYEMVTGIKPFAGPGFDEFRFQHMKRFPAPPKVHNHNIPSWLDAMIVKCLDKEPQKRWRSPTQMELAIGKTTGE